jgi:hypothetical protein
MPNMYIAEFATTGGVNGGTPSGSTGTLPGLPWTPASFNPGTNPNFRRMQTIQIPSADYPVEVGGDTDTIAYACDAGNNAYLLCNPTQGRITVSSTPATLVGRGNVV